MTENSLPPPGGKYVRDSLGVIWRVVRDGGMATTADNANQYSAGIVWLEKNRGPLEKIEPPLKQESEGLEKLILLEMDNPPSTAIVTSVADKSGKNIVQAVAAMWRLVDKGIIDYDAGRLRRVLDTDS